MTTKDKNPRDSLAVTLTFSEVLLNVAWEKADGLSKVGKNHDGELDDDSPKVGEFTNFGNLANGIMPKLNQLNLSIKNYLYPQSQHYRQNTYSLKASSIGIFGDSGNLAKNARIGKTLATNVLPICINNSFGVYTNWLTLLITANSIATTERPVTIMATATQSPSGHNATLGKTVKSWHNDYNHNRSIVGKSHRGIPAHLGLWATLPAMALATIPGHLSLPCSTIHGGLPNNSEARLSKNNRHRPNGKIAKRSQICGKRQGCQKPQSYIFGRAVPAMSRM